MPDHVVVPGVVTTVVVSEEPHEKIENHSVVQRIIGDSQHPSITLPFIRMNSDRVYFAELYNQTVGSKVPLSFPMNSSRADIYLLVLDYSAQHPSDTFRLNICYEKHTCNSSCNGEMHHEMEEEYEEIWKVRGGDWLEDDFA